MVTLRLLTAGFFAFLFASCSPDTGLTKQEVTDITSFVMSQSTNHIVGLERQPTGEVTVWTVAMPGGTNGHKYTLGRKPGGWEILARTSEIGRN